MVGDMSNERAIHVREATVFTTGERDLLDAYLSLHTNRDVMDSTSESTAPRVHVSGTVDEDGSITHSDAHFTGGEGHGPARRVGYWSDAVGGTYYGSVLLQYDGEFFNGDGEYIVTSATVRPLEPMSREGTTISKTALFVIALSVALVVFLILLAF